MRRESIDCAYLMLYDVLICYMLSNSNSCVKIRKRMQCFGSMFIFFLIIEKLFPW